MQLVVLFARISSNSVYTAPQQLKSVYTGRDKATIENHLKFVSIRHKIERSSSFLSGICRATLRHIQCKFT